jgi:selenocysteine-specific elongation factor
LGGEAVARLEVYHRTHPADPGMPLETLRRSLGQAEAAVQLVLDDLVASGAIVTSGGQARLATFLPRVEGGDAIVDRAVAVLAKAGLTPPTVAELNAQFSRTDIAATLRLAAGSGRVVAVERDRYYAAEAIATFVAALREIGGTGAASITPAGLRDRLGITRKFLIPLLEWADATGVTIRVGDARRLK